MLVVLPVVRILPECLLYFSIFFFYFSFSSLSFFHIRFFFFSFCLFYLFLLFFFVCFLSSLGAADWWNVMRQPFERQQNQIWHLLPAHKTNVTSYAYNASSSYVWIDNWRDAFEMDCFFFFFFSLVPFPIALAHPFGSIHGCHPFEGGRGWRAV